MIIYLNIIIVFAVNGPNPKICLATNPHVSSRAEEHMLCKTHGYGCECFGEHLCGGGEVWTVTPVGTCLGSMDSTRPEESWEPLWCITHPTPRRSLMHTHTNIHPAQAHPLHKTVFLQTFTRSPFFNVARLRFWWLVAAPSPRVLLFLFHRARGERKSASPTPRRGPCVPVGGVFLAAAVASTCDGRSTWQENILVNSPCASRTTPFSTCPHPASTHPCSWKTQDSHLNMN